MGHKYERSGEAPGLNFQREDNEDMEASNVTQHEPINRQTIIEAVRRAEDYSYNSDKMPPGQLVAHPAATGKYTFYFRGNGTPDRVDSILGKIGEEKLDRLTYKELQECRTLLKDMDLDAELKAVRQSSDLPSASTNSESTESEPQDMRVGTWHGFKGTKNLLEYGEPHDDEGLLNTHKD